MDIIGLVSAQRRSKVFDQLFTFCQGKSRSQQVILLFSTTQPELEAGIHAVTHPQELAVLGEPVLDPLPFAQQRFVRDTYGNFSLWADICDQ